MSHYDLAIIGCGGIGAACLEESHKRALSTIAFDQYCPPHDHGSSHGQTRAIRKAYFERPDYVPLLARAYELWARLNSVSNSRIWDLCGLIHVGAVNGRLIEGVRKSVQIYNLDVEEVSQKELEARFPGFRCRKDDLVLYEREAGMLFVEDIIRLQIARAQASSKIDLCFNTRVENWHLDSPIRIVTSKGTYTAERLIVTAGPWANEMLKTESLSLSVLRKHLYWLKVRNHAYRRENGTPLFVFDNGSGCFYGFPVIDKWGLKVAEHTGGEAIAPDEEKSKLDSIDMARVLAFLRDRLPDVSPQLFHYVACKYTMSPDEDFILDIYSESPSVAYCAGLSGHGYKFAPVLAEILLSLVCEGGTSHNIDFLRAARFL
ncbi:MAG: N-methyl-L-tryptophan oxidase [Cyanobacteria bacterium P01_H01_bin.15]